MHRTPWLTVFLLGASALVPVLGGCANAIDQDAALSDEVRRRGDARSDGDAVADARTPGADGSDAMPAADSGAPSDAGSPPEPDAGSPPGPDAGSPPDAGAADPFDVRARPAHVGPDMVLARTVPAYVRRRIHVAADGDDARSIEQAGDPATPWRSVDRVNAAMRSLTAGDGVLFRRGDVFRAVLNVTASGTESNPIFFGSYGASDAMPVLSGSDPVSGWTAFREEIRAASVDSRVQRVFVDGREMPLARTPNVGLLRNGTTSSSEVSAAGLGSVDWTGGRVWVQTLAWIRESRPVAGQSGDTVRWSGSTYAPARPNAGFIVEGALGALDDAGEWYWGDGRLYLRLPAGADWASARIEATTRVHSVAIGEGTNLSDLEFRGLEFANSAGAAWAQVDYTSYRVRVADCFFRNSDTEGVSTSGYSNESTFERNHFAGVRGVAAIISGGRDAVFARNIVEDQFMQPQRGMGFGTGCGPGGCERVRIEENYFLRSGYNAISITSNRGGIVRRNVVLDAMQLMSDGGSIYTYGNDSVGQQYLENVVVGAPGSGAGASDGYDGAYGIYMDNDVTGAVIARNLVIDAHYGSLINSGGSGSSLEDNSFMGCGWGMEFNASVTGARRNLMFATSPDEGGSWVDALSSASVGTLGPLEDNVYRQPFADRVGRHRAMVYTWDAWRNDVGQDRGSRFDGTAWPAGTRAGDRVRVAANTSLSARTYDLGEGTWVDVRTGAASPRTFTLEPFAHRILERR